MKQHQIQKNKGFTLIETMVAVFILTLAITGLLSLNASSVFSARYARNEITANYLLQEATDYIRNDRDTIVPNSDWNTFLARYGNTASKTLCFNASGCTIEFFTGASTPNPKLCATAHSTTFGTTDCPRFLYDADAINNGFYTYKAGFPKSDFKRQILMSVNPVNPNELDIKITVEWLNGSLVRSQTLSTSLLNWQ